MTDEEIKRKADAFWEKIQNEFFKEKVCSVCGGENCQYNETCIACGCQL